MTDIPEGFWPFEFDTGMGVITLPDRRCTECIAYDSYMRCTACIYKQILIKHALIEDCKRQKELMDYVKEHPESVQ